MAPTYFCLQYRENKNAESVIPMASYASKPKKSSLSKSLVEVRKVRFEDEDPAVHPHEIIKSPDLTSRPAIPMMNPLITHRAEYKSRHGFQSHVAPIRDFIPIASSFSAIVNEFGCIPIQRDLETAINLQLLGSFVEITAFATEVRMANPFTNSTRSSHQWMVLLKDVRIGPYMVDHIWIEGCKRIQKIKDFRTRQRIRMTGVVRSYVHKGQNKWTLKPPYRNFEIIEPPTTAELLTLLSGAPKESIIPTDNDIDDELESHFI